MSAIEADNLVRTFGGLRAVDGLSFTVEDGEVFGFLGPNGAGKTTTIGMLTGQLRPTSGHARVAGCDVANDRRRLRPRIGVVFECQNLYERLSGRENLDFAAALFGVAPKRVDEVLDQVRLRDRAADSVRHYSNGMKQRLLIARALLHCPQVLFLDEPTRGLDPIAAREIRRVVADLAGQGVTVFLTTHYMEEADCLCRRVAFIDHGRIVAVDTPSRLKVAYGQRSLRATLRDGSVLDLPLDDPDNARRLAELAAMGHLQTLHSAEATLEDVFVRLTGKGLLA
ncbi:MAG TPA: ABC transporter ATP-binding protein [Anaerolineae bacterium]|nr:ABC transporter ATP-binding protein [Anaerolineae bacterium]HPL30941.1 ABC transporter ATP-binding protein [Anaerolineae bacterium]